MKKQVWCNPDKVDHFVIVLVILASLGFFMANTLDNIQNDQNSKLDKVGTYAVR